MGRKPVGTADSSSREDPVSVEAPRSVFPNTPVEFLVMAVAGGLIFQTSMLFSWLSGFKGLPVVRYYSPGPMALLAVILGGWIVRVVSVLQRDPPLPPDQELVARITLAVAILGLTLPFQVFVF